MTENIKFWRGTPVNKLDIDELRNALAEVYAQLEWAQWEAHTAKKKLAKLTKGKKVIEDGEDNQTELAA